MIYDILPEWESFSAYHGGAVSHMVASMMTLDPSRSIVCKHAENRWGFDAGRIQVIPSLNAYGKLRGRRHFPLRVTGPLFRQIFEPFLLKLKRGDVVWCHSQPAICASLASIIRAKGAKLFYHSHSSLEFYAHRPHFRQFTPDAWIFISHAMHQEAMRLFPWISDTYVVHNGADERRFFPEEQSGPKQAIPLILYIGRLHETKGVHVLVEAMRILKERNVAARCKVVGSSFSGRTRATRYARALVRSGPTNVQFAPFRSNAEIAHEYRRADIVCCPSVWQEPFGNVNIEAMACGVPVVASRVGGIPEIGAEGGVVMVEPNSAIELADALQGLVENRDLRARVGQAGLSSFLHRFRWPIIMAQYQEIVTEKGIR
jgi:spore coat protein SA